MMTFSLSAAEQALLKETLIAYENVVNDEDKAVIQEMFFDDEGLPYSIRAEFERDGYPDDRYDD